MVIEFHTPEGKVSEEILNNIRGLLMEFHRKDPEIARAEVYFREDHDSADLNHVCEIDLTVYGDSLSVRRKAKSFKQASQEVLTELERMVDEQVRRQNDPPDIITSTVEI